MDIESYVKEKCSTLCEIFEEIADRAAKEDFGYIHLLDYLFLEKIRQETTAYLADLKFNCILHGQENRFFALVHQDFEESQSKAD